MLFNKAKYVLYLHFLLPFPLHDLGAADVEGLIKVVTATGVKNANFPYLFKKSRLLKSVSTLEFLDIYNPFISTNKLN